MKAAIILAAILAVLGLSLASASASAVKAGPDCSNTSIHKLDRYTEWRYAGKAIAAESHVSACSKLIIGTRITDLVTPKGNVRGTS